MGEAWKDRKRWMGGLLVAGCMAAIVGPPTIRGQAFDTPDAIEHLAIANAWVHGSGFVDPIQYNFYLQDTAPLPAMAHRAPVVPALLAIPLILGAGASATLAWHALWSVLVCVLSYLLATRFMKPWAAATAVLAVGTTPAWYFVALSPLTEATGLLALIAVVATARGVLGSPSEAIPCAVATWIAWLTRPNLGLMLAVVAIAVVWQLGPRRAVRHRALATYVAAFVALHIGTTLAVSGATGLAPYAGYGFSLEHVESHDWLRYGHEYTGAWRFLIAHQQEILSLVPTRLVSLWQVTCTLPFHGYLGWVIPIGLVHSAASWRYVRLEQAICSLATLGFAVMIVGNYLTFDAVRYPLPLMAVGLFSTLMAIETRVTHFASQAGYSSRARQTALAALLVAVLVRVSIAIADVPDPAAGNRGKLRRISAICPALAPDALVATSTPWSVHYLCGNPVIIMPSDIGADGILDRFLDERRPRYLIGRPGRFADEPRLERIGGKRAYAIHEVREVRGRPPRWNAPPAIACAGADWECDVREGRTRIVPPRKSPPGASTSP